MFQNAAAILDAHIRTMAVRIDVSSIKAVETITTTLGVVLLYANATKTRGLHALSDSIEVLQDAADEAAANAQQLSYFVAQLQWSSVFTIDTIITTADPFVFNLVVFKNLLPTLAAMDHIELDRCVRVVSSAVQPKLCEFSGQGLTAFDPYNTHDVYKQNVIHMVLRDSNNIIADWVTSEDICLKVDPDNASDWLALTFNSAQDGIVWRVVYKVVGACMRTSVRLSIEVKNVLVRQCNVQAMTPAAAIDLANVIHKKLLDFTESDVREIINVTAVFPTERYVQYNICVAMGTVACTNGAAGAKLVFDSSRVVTLAMNTFQDDDQLMYCASMALFLFAAKGGPSVQRELVSISGLVDLLKRTSAMCRAREYIDYAAKALLVLGVRSQHFIF